MNGFTEAIHIVCLKITSLKD